MTGETAGQYVDDSTITAAVKAKLVADKAANLTRVDVETTKQVVALNGIVESADQKARAEQLAKQVNGVRKVDNNLQIQKKELNKEPGLAQLRVAPESHGKPRTCGLPEELRGLGHERVSQPSVIL
jgi:hyperosmotically inducible periplasmic protein